MSVAAYLKSALALSLAGTLFAGYLSAVKLFSKGCAFNEPCPYFLGQPACYFGFALFAALFGITLAATLKKLPAEKAVRANLVVSLLGILFAGWFVWQEVVLWLSVGFGRYSLGLPTCAYGLVFYVAVFALTLEVMRRRPSPKG